MAEEKAEASAGGSGAAGGGKLVLILTAVNLLVTFGVIGVLFLSHKKEQTAPAVGDISVQAQGAHGEAEGAQGGHAEAQAEAGKSGDHAGAQATAQASGKMLPLEQFTVNLATVGSAAARFARVDISLEVPTDDTEAELARKMPQVRNTIIDLFNSKRPSDLATPEGRNYLKDEIKNALNSFLITGKIKGVFFTGFALSS